VASAGEDGGPIEAHHQNPRNTLSAADGRVGMGATWPVGRGEECLGVCSEPQGEFQLFGAVELYLHD